LKSHSSPVVSVVGGCGHVGLPLAISLAASGLPTVAFDIDTLAVEKVNAGTMPFDERGAAGVLRVVLEQGTFAASDSPSVIRDCQFVIVVIGTPVDDHLSPDPNAVIAAMSDIIPYMRDDQIVILRSTVYPGVTRRLEHFLRAQGLQGSVTFCPERILEGNAMLELRELPQIIGARTDEAARRSAVLFDALGVSTLVATPEEAELAKLFTNTWRYIKFAAANQFWLMATEAGLDYARIREVLTTDYPRAADLPISGFAAGPCLFKDTAQLAAFTNNTFTLGNAAMMVNEGQPLYLIERIAKRHDLSVATVGILGMAFKAESDDIRSSLSYKLKRILRFHAHEVITTDPFVTTDDDLLPLEDVLRRSDILIVGAPHEQYRDLNFKQPVYDVWNLLGRGTLV